MGTLKQTLRAMLASARQTEGQPIRRSLDRGLTVEVSQMSGGNVVVTLERLNTAPTEADWAYYVMGQFPERVPDGVVPSPRSEGRRHTLIGRWARPAEVTERAA